MEAKIVQKSPYPVNVESGKTYYYCTCGLSENQPFCNTLYASDPKPCFCKCSIEFCIIVSGQKQTTC